MITLDRLKPEKGARKRPKRVGRGPGSGWGKTAGRGHKGQRARSGGGVRPGFEGGQMPLTRRVPKGGFTNIFKKKYNIVNIRDLERFDSGAEIDPSVLMAAGLVKKPKWKIKLLGQGELSKSLTIRVHTASRGAVERIQSAGGKVEVI